MSPFASINCLLMTDCRPSAALLILPPAAAGTGCVAPDLVLGADGLNVYSLGTTRTWSRDGRGAYWQAQFVEHGLTRTAKE